MNSSITNCLLLAGLICFASIYCDDLDANTVIPDEVKEYMKSLPINSSALPTLEDGKKVVQEKCKKNGGDGAYEKVEKATSGLQECLQKQINVTALQSEIDNGTGNLDVVFAKYCKKTPDLLQCITDVTNATMDCLEETEKDSVRVALNVTESLANFLCLKDGDRMAMFIAEGGVECLTDRTDSIQKCVNDTLGSRIPTTMPGLDSLPMLLIGANECDDFMRLQECVVDDLSENCKEPTPGNIVEALFKFIRKQTPCAKYVSSNRLESGSRTSGASISMSALSFSGILGVVILKTLAF